MIENLTDEQLREWRDFDLAGSGPRAMATELLALHAERAKPTQSDEMTAHRLLVLFSRLSEDEDFETPLLAAFASIRAEGIAERALLEAALAELRPRYGAAHQMLCDHVRAHPATIDELIRDRVAVCAQPAESGATEQLDKWAGDLEAGRWAGDKP